MKLTKFMTIYLLSLIVLSITIECYAADTLSPAEATSTSAPIVAIPSISPTTVVFVSDNTPVDFRVDISIINWLNTYNTLLLECKDSNDKIIGVNSIGITTSVNDKISLNAVSTCTFPGSGTYKIEVHLKADNNEISNTDSHEIIVTQ